MINIVTNIFTNISKAKYNKNWHATLIQREQLKIFEEVLCHKK